MNITTAIILNALLDLAVIGGLALVVRLAHRLDTVRRAETLHPSQPIPLHVVAGEHAEREPARAA